MKRCLNCMEEHEENDRICPHCGWQESQGPKDALEIGSILENRYIVGTVRCRGSSDYLYVGWDALFSRRVLILEYFPADRAVRRADGTVEADPEYRDWFLHEVYGFLEAGRKLIMLDDTPGLLNVFAATEDFGTAYIIMDYPEAKALAEILQEQKIWEPHKVQELIQRLSSPLAAAHNLGVCHGQIDGNHILILPDGGCVLGGFHKGMPAQESGNRQEMIRLDIEALARLAGSMLTGSERWEQLSLEENLDFLRGNTPECITDALKAVLGRDETRRPGSARRFADLFLDEATIELAQP